MGKDYVKHKEWLNTKKGRASTLLNAYNHKDESCGRGKGDLTSEWIVENIFSKPCAHCGETNWRKIGCNRLDNSKPHTKDNIEPCCKECNDKLHSNDISKKVYQYTLDDMLVGIYSSANEAARQNNYSQGTICGCCNKRYGRKTYKGYKWSFEPL